MSSASYLPNRQSAVTLQICVAISLQKMYNKSVRICTDKVNFSVGLIMIRDRIRQARKENGYTQDDMAAVLGVDRSTYTYYETGKCELPVKALLVASSVFDLPIEWFMTNDEGKPETAIVPAASALNSTSIFLPETAAKGRKGAKAAAAEEPSEKSCASTLTSEERVMLARYRVLKSTGRIGELAEYMKQLVNEKIEAL